MREIVIENYLRDQVKKMGGRAYKFTSSAYRSIPDRMCVFPHGVIVFVEVKAPGRKPTIKQWKEIQLLRKLGQHVVVLDSRPKVDSLLQWVKGKVEKNAETAMSKYEAARVQSGKVATERTTATKA